MESKLWDGNFCHISLYNSLEHLPSDTSCIKTSLIYMARYIENKKFDMTKSKTYKALAKLLGNLFLPSIRLDGTYLSLIFTITPLNKRYNFTVP